MEPLYRFIIQYAPWLLGGCTLVFVWNFVRMLLRQRDGRNAYYHLERDKAGRARDRALWLMVLALAVGSAVLFITMRIAPSLPDVPVPTAEATPTSGLTGTGGSLTERAIAENQINTELIPYPTATAVIAPTATLRNPGEVSQELRPQAQPTRAVLAVEPLTEGCSETVQIDQPPSGATLSEGVTLFGRATTDSFDYYSVLIRGPETADLWVDLLDGTVNSPVENGFLGSGRFADWETGIYQIELVITDQAGNSAETCMIQIGILNEAQNANIEG